MALCKNGCANTAAGGSELDDGSTANELRVY